MLELGDVNMRARGALEQAVLRVGFVGTAYPPVLGGMEVYLYELARALARAEHSVQVATRFVERRPPTMADLHAAVEPARTYCKDGVAVHVMGPTRWERLALRPVHRLHFRASTRPAAKRLVTHAFRRSLDEALTGSDVVHYSGTGREMFGFAAASMARRHKVPLVITPHSHAGVWGDGPIDLDLYRHADRVIALTEDERTRLVEAGLADARIRVLGHGVSVRGDGDGRRFRARHGIDGPIVLYLGRKAAYKGYGLLRSAADAVWAERPDVHVVYAGPADESEPQALPGHHRLHDLGVLSDEEREDAYAACDVFCLPSSAEAFGLVYLEAWAYGKPVVALQIPTLEELIGRVGGGLLAAPSAAAVADALLRLLGDEDLRQRLGAAGAAEARYRTWAHVATAMGEIYAEACADYARRGAGNDSR